MTNGWLKLGNPEQQPGFWDCFLAGARASRGFEVGGSQVELPDRVVTVDGPPDRDAGTWPARVVYRKPSAEPPTNATVDATGPHVTVRMANALDVLRAAVDDPHREGRASAMEELGRMIAAGKCPAGIALIKGCLSRVGVDAPFEVRRQAVKKAVDKYAIEIELWF